jgi:hypothetical protein
MLHRKDEKLNLTSRDAKSAGIAGLDIIWPEMKADYDKESIKKIVVYIAWS